MSLLVLSGEDAKILKPYLYPLILIKHRYKNIYKLDFSVLILCMII